MGAKKTTRNEDGSVSFFFGIGGAARVLRVESAAPLMDDEVNHSVGVPLFNLSIGFVDRGRVAWNQIIERISIAELKAMIRIDVCNIMDIDEHFLKGK
jgi:hypothetical protein